MSDGSPFLLLDQPCDRAVGWVIKQINKTGLRVLVTFDLQVARLAHFDCKCPYHGTDQCDCQMVVLLVYSNGKDTFSEQNPVSIVAHGHSGQTWFSVVDTPQQRADPRMETAIRLSLTHNLAAAG